MPVASWPRISQAKELFPLIREHLVAAAVHHSVPAGLSLELLPIVEDGLVGYEFLPNQATNSYVTIGCDDLGVPVLRQRKYRADSAGGLRVASINGRKLSPSEKAAGNNLRRRDAILHDWASTAEAAWIELASLFPQQPRHSINVDEACQHGLDEALDIAHAHLAEWDPCIDFCGVPDEAQYGFALTHSNGGRGLLAARQPGHWVLWFQSPYASINEEWTVLVPANGRSSAWATAGSTRLYTPQHAALLYPVSKTAAGRARNREKSGDRREGDRRNADRRNADRRNAERRVAERRNVDSFDPDRLVERRQADRRRRDRRDRRDRNDRA
jgi:hypothetical protein